MQTNRNFELKNKKVLIVGFGRIGRKLIKRCLGFEMKVYAFDPYEKTGDESVCINILDYLEPKSNTFIEKKSCVINLSLMVCLYFS